MKVLRASVFSSLLSAVLFLSSCVCCNTAPETVPVLSEAQKSYQVMPRKERIAYFADAEKRKEMRSAGFYPQKHSIKIPADAGVFTLKEVSSENVKPKTIKAGKITVLVPAYLLATVKDGKLEIQNMKIATLYQWTMNADGMTSKGSFRTEDMPPRLMRLDGVGNVRDLGGRIGLNGRRVRQGRVYRTAGLNDNASIRQYSIDEIPKVKKNLSKEALAAIDEYHKLSAKIKKGDFVTTASLPCKWDSRWTAFRPVGGENFFTPAILKEIAAWKEIPAEFHGGKAIPVEMDGLCKFSFPKPNTFHPAVFVKVIDSPKAGTVSIGCAADWYFSLYVNGQCVYDALAHGNEKWPISLNNHIFEIKIRKGRNIIAVPMRSGSASFTVCCGVIQKEYADLVKLERKIHKMAGTSKGMRRPGKERLSSEMKRYVVQDLGLRSDIDLRTDGECFGMVGSPAGKQVVWFHHSSSAYGGLQYERGRMAFKKVFQVFLDEKNYPIAFHCIAGQDRTGAVAFVLNGLLGVSEEQLYLDWESTGYWNRSAKFCHERLFNHLVKGFDRFPGKTIHERIENFVYSLGFTKADVEHFRSLMLEPKK